MNNFKISRIKYLTQMTLNEVYLWQLMLLFSTRILECTGKKAHQQVPRKEIQLYYFKERYIPWKYAVLTFWDLIRSIMTVSEKG